MSLITRLSDVLQVIGGDVASIEQRLADVENIAPTWYGPAFGPAWSSLANYPVEIAQIAPNTAQISGIVTATATFSFTDANLRKILTLPAVFHPHDPGSGNQIFSVWGNDTAGSKTMYRLVLVAATNVLYVDQSSGSATGGAGTVLMLDGLIFRTN